MMAHDTKRGYPPSIFDYGKCNWRPEIIKHKGVPLRFVRSMGEKATAVPQSERDPQQSLKKESRK